MRNKIIALTIVGAMTFSITTPVTATNLNEIIKENDSKDEKDVLKVEECSYLG